MTHVSEASLHRAPDRALRSAAAEPAEHPAFGVTCNMLVAVFLLHIQNGFFMNWGGTQAGEGFELHLLVLAMTALLMWKGSGAWSLDAVLARRIQAAPTQPRRAEAGAPARAA